MAFTVWVRQLQSEDGALYRGVEGIEADEERVQFSEAVAETTNRTIVDLKLLIMQQFFPGQQKSTSRIKVYLFSNADSGDARADGPDVQSPTDALLDGRRYGFIDLDFARPRVRGVLPRVQGGGLYRINDERVRCKFTIKNHVSSSECLMMPAELMVDAGARSELKLPGRKVVQLGLMPIRGLRRVRGSTNHFGEVSNFAGVIVSATFDRDGSSETVEAYLTVHANTQEYEEALANGTDQQAASTPQRPPLETTGEPPRQRRRTEGSPSSGSTGVTEIRLSPVTHRPRDKPDEHAVIGIEGLKNLRLHINCERQQLEIEEEELLDPEW
jgi:predicted aspartyl protease